MFYFFFLKYPIYRFDGWFGKEVVVCFWSKIYYILIVDTIYPIYPIISYIVKFEIRIIFFE
jgi:hypothetical protein